jgi:hypothetical protein
MVVDAVSLVSPDSPQSLTPAAVEVALTNFGGACTALATGGSPPASGAILVLDVQSGAVAGQSFAIDGFTTAATYEANYTNTCHTFTSANVTTTSKFSVLQTASAGTIKLDTITSTMVGGSFDLTFASGDHLTGTFTAPQCPNAIPGGGC